MLKLIIALNTIFLFVYSYGQTDIFNLKIHFNSNSSKSIYIFYYSSEKGIGYLDSCVGINGICNFKGKIKNSTLVFVSLKNSRVIDTNVFTIFIEPQNMEATFESSPFRVTSFYGSESQKLYDQLLKENEKVYAEYAVYFEKAKTETGKELKSVINEKISDYRKQAMQIDTIFFNLHPDSYVTAYKLQGYYDTFTPEVLQGYYNKMGQSLKESIYGAELAYIIKRKKAVSFGKKAIQFSTTDINNTPLSLSDYIGKYVLLDFWAS